MPLKGLAQAGGHPEDLDTLGCQWYYQWGTNVSLLSDARYVPMSRDGKLVSLPIDYSGYLLVFNEPNVKEPNGCDTKVSLALCRYARLVEEYPQAKMIVGGVSYWDKSTSEPWIKSFRDGLSSYGAPKPYGYHFHGYKLSNNTTVNIEAWWKKMHDWMSLPIWVTEYNAVSGSTNDLKKLTEWIKLQPWIERYACFTNRSSGEPWAIGDGVNLVNNNGTLKPNGAYYAIA